MKKIFSILVVAVFFGFASSALACYNGDCERDPDPCGTADCLGGETFGGKMQVLQYGYAAAYGDTTQAFSGGQFDLSKQINTNGVTGQVDMMGGFLSESAGEHFSEAGGIAEGAMKFNYRGWEGIID